MLDLTGNPESTPASAPAVLDLTQGDETTDQEGEQETPETEGESVASGQERQEDTGDTTSGGSDADSGSADDGASTTDVELFFDGQAVKVDVPDEVSNALKEAGVEPDALVKQLFKKDGDFSLDEETYGKLTDKFGKVMVDGYLSLYKQQNTATLNSHNSEQEQAEKTMEAHGKEYASAVGGEEGLEALESYISKNFNEDQIAAYNATMESDNHQGQLLLISQVKQLMEMQNKLENGDSDVELLGDSGASASVKTSPLDKGYLTSAEYQSIMDEDNYNGKYWNDAEYRKRVDAARIAGQKLSK